MNAEKHLDILLLTLCVSILEKHRGVFLFLTPQIYIFAIPCRINTQKKQQHKMMVLAWVIKFLYAKNNNLISVHNQFIPLVISTKSSFLFHFLLNRNKSKNK